MVDLSLMIFTIVICIVSVVVILSAMRVAVQEDREMERQYYEIVNQLELIKRYQEGGVKRDE